MDEMLPTMVKQTLDLHVLPNLAFVAIVITSFDLWMFRGNANVFALTINFLNESWTHMHVTMGLFEVNETSGQNMVIQPKSLLSKFELIHYVITFVKDEAINLTTMASMSHSIIHREPLKFIKVYEGT